MLPSTVPGNASGSVEGVAIKGLTVDFHEPGFVSSLSKEHQQDFWFRLSEDDKKQAGSPWGPANPQSLNRYSYVLNGPVRWTDPSGHWVLSFGFTIRAGAYLGGSYSAGVTFDGEGNVAVYKTTTKGATIGATIGASGGGTLLPNTPTIDKTVGKGFNIGLSLPTEPGIGGDFGFDTRKENPAYSFSVGVGAGADIHIEKTDTTLKARNLPQRIYSEVVNRVIRYAMPSDIPY